MKRTIEIKDAYKALEDAYEQDRQRRASIAWQHGVKFVVYNLQEGHKLEDIMDLAKMHGVKF